jgi:hypothetical protein
MASEVLIHGILALLLLGMVRENIMAEGHEEQNCLSHGGQEAKRE